MQGFLFQVLELFSKVNLKGRVHLWEVPSGRLVGAEAAMTMALALPDLLAFRCECQENIAVFPLVLQAGQFLSQDFRVYQESRLDSYWVAASKS